MLAARLTLEESPQGILDLGSTLSFLMIQCGSLPQRPVPGAVLSGPAAAPTGAGAGAPAGSPFLVDAAAVAETLRACPAARLVALLGREDADSSQVGAIVLIDAIAAAGEGPCRALSEAGVALKLLLVGTLLRAGAAAGRPAFS